MHLDLNLRWMEDQTVGRQYRILFELTLTFCLMSAWGVASTSRYEPGRANSSRELSS